MATEIWVNIGSGHGLLPDGTKPLPEPMLTDHQWSPSDIHIRAISQEMDQPSSTKICLKITHLTFHSNFPGANELKAFEKVLFTRFFSYLPGASTKKIVVPLSGQTHYLKNTWT